MNREAVILGIIAEYDPFHNGHLHHLSVARRMVHPDTVYTVLSPCLKQRGTLSLLSPYDRAACALCAGADAVFALPVLWTVRDAEHYALGAVSLLCGMGITHLAFGAETDDLNLLRQAADFLDNPHTAFPGTLKSFLGEGFGYPAALSRALAVFLPEAGQLIAQPNNILAVCYLRALKKLDSHAVPIVIRRSSGFHDPVIRADSASASAIRRALQRGHYSAAYRAVPAFSAAVIRKAFLSGRTPDPELYDILLLECLRSSDISSLPDLSEGLGDALKKAASDAGSAAEMTARLSSRRYTAARISRLCAMAMLGVTAERIRNLPLPSSGLLLALRPKKVPTDRWKDLPVRIISSFSEWRECSDPEDLRAWHLWAACCRLPDTLPFTERVYTE